MGKPVNPPVYNLRHNPKKATPIPQKPTIRPPLNLVPKMHREPPPFPPAINGRILQACINLGIGSILIIKAQLDAVKGRFDKIYISPNWDLVKKFRNDDSGYKEFVRELMKALFSEPPYIITDDQSYPKKDYTHLDLDDGLPAVTPTKNVFARLLCNQEMPIQIDGKFVIITTKARSYRKSLYDEYNKALKILWKELSEKYKIVLMGEKEIEMNKEYSIQPGNAIYSIYKDIVSSIPKDRIIDLTYDKLGFKSPNIKKFREDCTIMNRAERIFCVGIGGNWVIANAVGIPLALRDKNMIKDFYPREKVDFTTKMFGDNSNLVTEDINKFVQIAKSIEIPQINIDPISKTGNRILKGKINTGIGDHIYVKAQLDFHKNEFDKIYLSPNLEWMKGNAGSEYENRKRFMLDYMTLLYQGDPYVITEDQTYPQRTVLTFMDNDGLTPATPHLEKYLCDDNVPVPEGDYIVITTKARQKNVIDEFHKISTTFFQIINDLSAQYKIILMGEKRLPVPTEKYKCLYDILSKNIKIFDDRTLPLNKIQSPSLTQIKNDCSIMRKAKATIAIGDAGNFCLAMAVGNTIVLKGDGGKLRNVETYLYGETYDKDGQFVTQTAKFFLAKLRSLKR